MQKDLGHQTSLPAPPVVQGKKSEELPMKGQLISFGDRITYTFAYGTEVGSIHFDRGRGEIFYKGHNIRNIEIEDWQWQVMESLRHMLSQHETGHTFSQTYGHILDKVILEKKRGLEKT